MKKLIAFVLALLMLPALICVPVSAEKASVATRGSDTSDMYADFKAYVPASVTAGEEFSVVVDITGNYEAHILKLQLGFDPEKFEYVSGSNGPILTQVAELGGVSMLTLAIGGKSLILGIIMPYDPFTGSGELYTATFRAKQNIEYYDYDFTLIITDPNDFALFPNGGQNSPIQTHSEEVLPVDPTADFHARIFAVSTEEARPGDDIELSLNIEGEYRMTGLQINLYYDLEVFEVTDFIPGEVLNAATAAGGYRFEDYSLNPGEVSMIMLLPYADISDDGVIYTLKMHVADDAEPGEYRFDLDLVRFVYSAPGTTAVFSIQDVAIESAETEIIDNYTVTWVNSDGTVLEVDKGVEAGTMPEYNGEEPTKQSDDRCIYFFTGWDPELSEVTDDVTYTAVFEEAANTCVSVELGEYDLHPHITWNELPDAYCYQLWRKAEGGEYELIATTEETSFIDASALTPRTDYYYRVNALYPDDDAGAFSVAAMVTYFGLDMPSRVKAVIKETRPLISWNAAANATHYEVYRCIAGSDEYAFIGVSDGLSFSDSDELVPLTKYYYKVKAVDSYGNESPLSSFDSVITYGIKAPAGVKAVISETMPLISWKAAANAAYYEVYRSTSKSGEYALIGTTEELSFTDSDELVPFTKYYYKVKALDDYGFESDMSSSVYVIAYGIKAPAGVSAVISETMPLISWKAAANATHYEVYRSTSKSGEYALIGTTEELSFTDSDELVPFTKYYYKVKALDNYGFESNMSSSVYAIAYGIKSPAGVSAVISETKPLISWNAAVNSTHYEVYRSTSKSGEYALIGTTEELNFTDDGELFPLKRYYYKVKALDDYGFESSMSSRVYVTAYGIKAPTGVSAVISETNQPFIYWNAAANAAHYAVYRSTVKSGEYVLIGTTEELSFTDDDELIPLKRYYYKVKALDDFGFESPFSSYASFTAGGAEA